MEITSLNRSTNTISFKYTEPKQCYTQRTITCNNINAELDSSTQTGRCDNLESGTEYLINASVSHKGNTTITHSESIFTGKAFKTKLLLIVYLLILKF